MIQLFMFLVCDTVKVPGQYSIDENVMQNGFDLAPGLIHLNHAAVAPWPTRTRDAVCQFANENVQQGSSHYPHWLQVESELRELLARLIHAPSPDDIALLKSTSEALSVVACGLPWQSGDQVLISNEEFPSNRIVWQAQASRGVTLCEVDLAAAASPTEALIAACTVRTRLIAISSIQYTSGLRVDLPALSAHCRKNNILLCVDAIQSIGAMQFDLREIDADFVMADGHKWMLGPEGLALFYCRAELRNTLTLQQFGWHMVEHHKDFSLRDWQPAQSARRFECGSPNMLCVHALHASISLLLETDMAQVEQAVLANSETLFKLLAQSTHLECITNTQVGNYGGIVVFRHRSADNTALYQYLMKNNVLCAPRGGGIRFSPHFYTPHSHLEQAVALADQFVSEEGA